MTKNGHQKSGIPCSASGGDDHRSEQKLRDFASIILGMYICIREYSNQAKFNTFLLNHLSEIGPVEMI
jgi:hypothetical protein